MADNLQTFVGVIQNFTCVGLFKATGSIGFGELAVKPMAAQFQEHHLNRLYFGDSLFVDFQQQADTWSRSDAVARYGGGSAGRRRLAVGRLESCPDFLRRAEGQRAARLGRRHHQQPGGVNPSSSGN